MIRWIGSLVSIFLCATPIFADRLVIGGNRPATLLFPKSSVFSGPWPVLLYLHGYGGHAQVSDDWIGASREALQLGYAVILPEGNRDGIGRRFWNATPECCDFFKSGVDDAAYLQQLLTEAQRRAPVDPQRMYVMGHSNGGFMAYRLACEYPNLLRGLIVVAGASFRDMSQCLQSRALNSLHIHGLEDTVIPFRGDSRFPSAEQAIMDRAQMAKCKSTQSKSLARELIGSPYVAAPGSPPVDTSRLRVLQPDTDTEEWLSCDDDVRIALWKIRGASHRPEFYGSTIREALEFVR